MAPPTPDQLAWLEQVLVAAPDAMIVADASGIVRKANQQAAALFGYARDELEGQAVEALVPQDRRGAHAAHREGFLDAPSVRPMGAGLELAGLRKDGGEFPVEISLSPIEVQGERWALAAIRDVSARKSQEAKFRALLEAAPDAMIIVEHSGQIVLANAQAEAVFGWDRDELLGQKIETLIPQRFHGRHEGHRTGFFSQPKVRPMGAGLQLLGLHKDGHEFPVEISLSPIETEEGTLVTAAVRDVTERVRKDEELQRRQHQLTEAQALAHLGSWEWDIPKDKVYWSDELYRIYGLEPQCREIDYGSYLELLHPEDRDTVDATIQHAFKTGEPFDFQHRIVRPDGDIRWLHGRGELLKNEQGDPLRMVGTALDITEATRIKEQLEASLDQKEVLLKEVHHRVKNNLQIVSSLLNLQRARVDEPLVADVLLDSRNRIQSLALVHERLYRSEDIEALDLSKYVQDLVRGLQRSMGRVGTKMRVTVAPIEVELDRAVTLGLLINELVSNAFKHGSGDEGHVQVTLEGGAETLRIRVADDGPGLPPGTDITKAQTLGLNLVTSLCDQLGATFDVAGPPGTTWTIEVPT